MMKTTVILMLAGALLGVLVASLLVPPALAWYTAPGGLPQGTQIQALVQIPEVIRYATGRLMRWQLIGAGIGAAIGLGVGLFLTARGTRVAAGDHRATPA
jgi:hypothetical protein